jgi:hypothetical protein
MDTKKEAGRQAGAHLEEVPQRQQLHKDAASALSLC